jgi:CHAT domain-containing protein
VAEENHGAYVVASQRMATGRSPEGDEMHATPMTPRTATCPTARPPLRQIVVPASVRLWCVAALLLCGLVLAAVAKPDTAQHLDRTDGAANAELLALDLAIADVERRLGNLAPELLPLLRRKADALFEAAEQLPAALLTWQRLLALQEAIYGPSSPELVSTLHAIGWTQGELRGDGEALSAYSRALEIAERPAGPPYAWMVGLLQDTASLHLRTRSYDLALPLLQRALSIETETKGADHADLLPLLRQLREATLMLGDTKQALLIAERVWRVASKTKGPADGEAIYALRYFADWYLLVRPDWEFVHFFDPELAVAERNLGPAHAMTRMLRGIVAAGYRDVGRHEHALILFNRNLMLTEQLFGPSSAETLFALQELGGAYWDIGRYEEALPWLERARTIMKERSVPYDLLFELGLAQIHQRMGRHDLSKPINQRALSHLESQGALQLPSIEGMVLFGSLRDQFAASGDAELATFWGKEAVHVAQAVRSLVHGKVWGLELKRTADQKLMKVLRSNYDRLAEVLIDQGRYAEAQQVLQMLKERELHELIERSGGADSRSTRIELTGLEEVKFARYYELRDQQARLAQERLLLREKEQQQTLSDAELNRLRAIGDQQAVISDAVRTLMNALTEEFAQQRRQGQPVVEVRESNTRLRSTVEALARSEPRSNAVGLQYFPGQDRLTVFVVTRGGPPLVRQMPITRKQLEDLVFTLDLQLRDPSSEHSAYLATARKLHDALIAPIQADLQALGARTLMLSLNGVLRYVPFAALHDGQRFLVQRYSMAMFNDAGGQSSFSQGAATWKVAGMGLTTAVGDLPALPGVQQEVQSVVRMAGGQAFLDNAFDRRTLAAALGSGFNVLHLASHFVFTAGRPDQSHLYLGDKSRLSLSDIVRQDMRFDGFDLVALSACETGQGGGRDALGQEMEGLGARAQQQGAQAVMATLWKVYDKSTASLMQGFYRARVEGQMNKADAMRAAQLAMLEPAARPPGIPRKWAHPYYWAPFVIMGNWR